MKTLFILLLIISTGQLYAQRLPSEQSWSQLQRQYPAGNGGSNTGVLPSEKPFTAVNTVSTKVKPAQSHRLKGKGELPSARKQAIPAMKQRYGRRKISS